MRSGTSALIVVASSLAALSMLAPACTGALPTGPGAGADCSGATLTPGPCDEPFSEGPDPIFPENRCPTPAEVELINQEIPVSVREDATAGQLACRAADGSVDLTPARAAMYRGLLFMRRVKFHAPLPWTDGSLYDWLHSSIPRGVVVIASGNSFACTDCLGPVFIYWPAGTRSAGVDLFSAASIIVHEARHTNNRRHTCSPAQGGFTLDRTIAELGAMGVDYYYRQWVATQSDEHPDAREYARRSAARLRRSFCCECPTRSAAALAPEQWLARILPGPLTPSFCGG